MARQPDAVDGITMEVPGGFTDQIDREEPQVGDIYRSRSGQAAFWWIVAIVQGEYHHTAFYLTFNSRGEMVGQGKAAMHYIRDRPKAGHADVPVLQPTWF